MSGENDHERRGWQRTVRAAMNGRKAMNGKEATNGREVTNGQES